MLSPRPLTKNNGVSYYSCYYKECKDKEILSRILGDFCLFGMLLDIGISSDLLRSDEEFVAVQELLRALQVCEDTYEYPGEHTDLGNIYDIYHIRDVVEYLHSRMPSTLRAKALERQEASTQ